MVSGGGWISAFEEAIEIGQTGEADLEGDSSDTWIGIPQKQASALQAPVYKVVGKGGAGHPFEEAGEGGNTDIKQGRDILKWNVGMMIFGNEFVNQG